MHLRTTSTQRTYRYVRLAIVGVVVLLGVAVTVQIITGGPLTSVSAAYYTPAGGVFTGALFAVALALLALSGRSVEQALLDVAALLAPVIAVVPTPVESGDISNVRVSCPGEGSCVPTAVLPDVVNGMLSLTVVGIVGWGAAIVLAGVQRTMSAPLMLTFAGTGAIIIGAPAWAMLSPETFALGAHYVAAAGFFAAIAVVAVLAALRPVAPTARRRRRLRWSYAVIAGGIVIALVVVVATVVLRAVGVDLVSESAPLFFIGEAAALALFAAFWVAQTIELWSDPDPDIRAMRNPS